jgi:FKBP-type peptidyl-prolyl cis-trans isomerase 2
METIKENDFVELEYTGKGVESGEIFDTTSVSVAKENNIFDEHTSYGPAIVCIGKRHLLPGLDKQVVGKDIGKAYTVKLSPEEAFGKKNGKLIQLISTSKFRQQQMTPYPGLQINIDGVVGTVKAVTGGRTIVDFNHPLSGREVEYTFTAKRIITDLVEKIKAMLKLIGIKSDAVTVSTAEGAATLEFPKEIPEELKKDLEEKLKAAIPELKTLSFNAKEAPKADPLAAKPVK